MSRTATATPPPPYFPQRVSTPTLRHNSAPHISHHGKGNHQHMSKRRIKAVAGFTPRTAKPNVSDGLGLSFEDVSKDSTTAIAAALSRNESTASFATANSVDSFPSIQSDDTEESMRLTPTPSFSFTASSEESSFITTPIATPHSGILVSLPALTAIDGAEDGKSVPPHVQSPNSAARASWAANIGKMAKAVVNTGITLPWDRKKTSSPAITSPSKQQTVLPGLEASPSKAQGTFQLPPALPRPTAQQLANLSSEEALLRQREWAEAERQRVVECARLCSQWPQSGYNQSKFGPNGAKTYYEPQSYANPQYVETVMRKQAALEQYFADSAKLFFSCHKARDDGMYGSRRRRQTADSDQSSVPSDDSDESSLPSPTTSTHFVHPNAKTTAEIMAAMSSRIIPDYSQQSSMNASEVSLLLRSSPRSIAGTTRSISELDVLASSMLLATTSPEEEVMDVDGADLSTPIGGPTLKHQTSFSSSTLSCGAKRPSAEEVAEEEKRRKVDEEMVVEEAVESGVMVPLSTETQALSLSPVLTTSASTPDLPSQVTMPSMGGAAAPSFALGAGAAAGVGAAAVFGHVIKTSDTHPIIISPFLAPDLLPLLTTNLVFGSTYPYTNGPLLLSSKLDIPSILLSHRQTTAPRPTSPPTGLTLNVNTNWDRQGTIGNLLLSSCPGKRLRMDGPVKGRGPVCRDLKTDLLRIKGEGVGCLVCCLDDVELDLLGAPWKTYSQIASEIGLDVIRLPMPDGFTPVSMSLFDSQVQLIVTKYTLQGINTLVHCRGGVGRAGLTACAWAIKMGFVTPHPSFSHVDYATADSSELEHQIVMSMVERVIAMIRSRRGLKAIESFEQVQFLAAYVAWLRGSLRDSESGWSLP